MELDWSYAEPENEALEGGMFSEFFDGARARIGEVLTPMTAPEGPSIQSQLLDAIYSYGRGKVDEAREKAVGAFLQTSEGKKAQAEGMRQTIEQYLPIIVLIVVGIFALGMFARR
jgi:hypothetical protein